MLVLRKFTTMLVKFVVIVLSLGLLGVIAPSQAHAAAPITTNAELAFATTAAGLLQATPLPMDVPYAGEKYSVKLSYKKYCDTGNKKVYVDVSQANYDGATYGTILCSGKFYWKIKMGKKKTTVSVYFLFTRGNNWSRISLLLHVTTPEVKKGNWKVSPNTIGYIRPKGKPHYEEAVYHWFSNRAAKKLFMVADFFRHHYKNGKKWTSEHFQRSVPVSIR